MTSGFRDRINEIYPAVRVVAYLIRILVYSIGYTFICYPYLEELLPSV